MLGLSTLAGFVAMMSFTVAANLMLKLGAAASDSERVFFGILGWKSASGLVLFGFGGIIYSIMLRSVPLNVAQAFAAMQFVAVILAASWVLNESIPPVRWFGIFCAIFGVLIVGLTAAG
jgi:drug/metabolite transporter (DMT)-like permease